MGEALVDTVLDYPLWPDSYAYKIQSQNILMAFREYMPVQMPQKFYLNDIWIPKFI